MSHPFTDKYIEMVSAADQVQALSSTTRLREPPPGNFYYCPRRSEVWASPSYPPGGWAEHDVDKWLPRLDQLLGMIGKFPKDFMIVAEQHHRDWFDNYRPHQEDWHELVLAMVMEVNFKMRWNDRCWEAIR